MSSQLVYYDLGVIPPNINLINQDKNKEINQFQFLWEKTETFLVAQDSQLGFKQVYDYSYVMPELFMYDFDYGDSETPYFVFSIPIVYNNIDLQSNLDSYFNQVDLNTKIGFQAKFYPYARVNWFGKDMLRLATSDVKKISDNPTQENALAWFSLMYWLGYQKQLESNNFSYKNIQSILNRRYTFDDLIATFWEDKFLTYYNKYNRIFSSSIYAIRAILYFHYWKQKYIDNRTPEQYSIILNLIRSYEIMVDAS